MSNAEIKIAVFRIFVCVDTIFIGVYAIVGDPSMLAAIKNLSIVQATIMLILAVRR